MSWSPRGRRAMTVMVAVSVSRSGAAHRSRRSEVACTGSGRDQRAACATPRCRRTATCSAGSLRRSQSEMSARDRVVSIGAPAAAAVSARRHPAGGGRRRCNRGGCALWPDRRVDGSRADAGPAPAAATRTRCDAALAVTYRAAHGSTSALTCPVVPLPRSRRSLRGTPRAVERANRCALSSDCRGRCLSRAAARSRRAAALLCLRATFALI